MSSLEDTWRILGFPIHEHSPTVMNLDIHLENGQQVHFTPANVAQALQLLARLTLQAFFEPCQTNAFARTLFYCQVLEHHTLTLAKKWKWQEKGFALGCVYTVHPNNIECYFLLLLLHTVPGPTLFEYLKTINSEVCDTYQVTCLHLGLLKSNEQSTHWMKPPSVSLKGLVRPS